MVNRENFEQLNSAYKDNEFGKIIDHELGVYFLKIRSISRAVLLRKLAAELDIDVEGISAVGDDLFRHIFLNEIPKAKLDEFIDRVYQKNREERQEDEDYLYSQLYKLKVFDWGGFYQNNVEQTLVNNYIKKIQGYDELCNKIENEINPKIKGYILCSWYNHWSSILIEDMFKDHPTVTPSVGRIKKVDFFWYDFPFDLKVTYFPDGFLNDKRRELDLSPEFTDLKRFARSNDIHYDRDARNNEIYDELYAKISESTSEEAKKFIGNLKEVRKDIVSETIENPNELIRWFYENQGTRRFDAANRFFVVLVDSNDIEESWKLKRNKKLLQSEINSFIEKHDEPDFNDMQIEFDWNDENSYTTYATVLFITK